MYYALQRFKIYWKMEMNEIRALTLKQNQRELTGITNLLIQLKKVKFDQ